MRDFVTAKFSKLEQFFDRINQVYIVLKVEKVTQIADANLHVNGGEIHASAEGQICMLLSMVLSISWQDS